MLLAICLIGVGRMKKEGKKSTVFNDIKRFPIRKNLRLAIIYTIITVLLATGIFLIISIRNPKYIDQKIPVNPYTNKAGVTYEIFMLPNDIFSEKSYGPGRIYITSLVDRIDTTLKYHFIGEKPADISGKYSVTAALEGFIPGEKSGTAIWQKQYSLLPETSFKTKDQRFVIEKKIPVRISDYSGYLDMVKKTLKFGFSMRLVIRWNILTEIKTEEGSQKETIMPVMEIPVSKEYFEVAGELSQENKGAIEKTEKIISPVYIKIKTACWIADALCAVLLLLMFIFTKPYTIDSPLQKKLKQVFKSHGSRMVGLGSETSINANEFIEISSMEDLVKIADDVGRPIMYRKSSNPEDIYYFYVIEENNIYVLDIRKTITYPPAENSAETDNLSM